MSSFSYRNLVVWQKSIELVSLVYQLTKQLPHSEQYGLSVQMQRSAVSIPSNIAEGKYRGSKKEFVRFLRYAFASGAELETQIELVKRLYAQQLPSFKEMEALLTEVMSMLNTLIIKIQK